MISYTLPLDGSIKLYDYLYRSIKDDIVAKRLVAGEKLPSKRALAAQLGVSVVTVETAYYMLIDEGYIISRERRGYFVQKIGGDMQPGAIQEAVSPSSIRQDQPVSTAGADIVADFTRSTNALFPYSIWSHLTRSMLSRSNFEKALVQPVPIGGLLALREAIAAHLNAFSNIHVCPENIIVGAGTEYLCALLIQLLGFGTSYAEEDPGYVKFSRIYKAHNVPLVPLHQDDCGIDMEALRASGAQVLLLSPEHQYPLGITTPIDRRKELLSWASAGNGRYIIEDEYDSEFRLGGTVIPSLKSMDTQGRVIYLNTFSKSLSPSIRISYMVLPPPLVDSFYNKLGFYSCTVSALEQATLATFIREGYFEKHINRMRHFYRVRRDYFLNSLGTSAIAPLCHITGDKAGLHFLLHIDASISPDTLRDRLLERKVKLLPLVDCYRLPPPVEASTTFVLDYSSTDEDKIDYFIAALSEVLKES